MCIRDRFLLTKEAQEHIVNNTFEYPMIDGVEPHDLVKQMGLGYKQDLNTKVVNYGKNQATALECMLAANWKQLIVKKNLFNFDINNSSGVNGSLAGQITCEPCSLEVEKMNMKINGRKLSEIEKEEVSNIFLSLIHI